MKHSGLTWRCSSEINCANCDSTILSLRVFLEFLHLFITERATKLATSLIKKLLLLFEEKAESNNRIAPVFEILYLFLKAFSGWIFANTLISCSIVSELRERLNRRLIWLWLRLRSLVFWLLFFFFHLRHLGFVSESYDSHFNGTTFLLHRNIYLSNQGSIHIEQG